jgi:hypothetical protein
LARSLRAGLPETIQALGWIRRPRSPPFESHYVVAKGYGGHKTPNLKIRKVTRQMAPDRVQEAVGNLGSAELGARDLLIC